MPNPLFGLRVISLPARNATAAIAITYAGMGMLVLAWLWIGRMLRAAARSPRRRTAPSSPAPACCGPCRSRSAPPMFSKDVYSYLAQSAITARGLDPYSFGPAAALGVDDPLTRTIPTIWRDTPAPYGPLFLMLGRGITALTGSDVIRGVFAHRILAPAGWPCSSGPSPGWPGAATSTPGSCSGSAPRTRWCCSTSSAGSTTRA